MSVRHGPRANLPANREERSGYKQRVNREAFGIYRPLTDESSEQIWEVVGNAKKDIKSFFGSYVTTAAELVVPAEMGVTFVMREKMRRAMKHGLLQRGFETARTIDAIESAQPIEPVALEVPLGSTRWVGGRERKLAFGFAESNATRELEQEAAALQGMLTALKAGELAVLEPDHVTLFKYGRARDGRDLSCAHKAIVGGILEEHFQDAGVTSVTLGRLVMGESYTKPQERVSHGP